MIKGHSFQYVFYLMIDRIRGVFYNLLFFNNLSSKLYIGHGFRYDGFIKVGKCTKIQNNVKLYKNCIIGENNIIGDNVEFRCNGNPNKIVIGNFCTINTRSIIGGMVTIGENCLIGPHCIIMGSNHVFENVSSLIKSQGIKSQGIVIENNVWLGANVVVLDGVTIGSGSVIGASSVVTKNIPSNSIVVGNPARIIRKRG